MNTTDTPIYHQLFLEYATNDQDGRAAADAILRRKQAQLQTLTPPRPGILGWFVNAVNWS